jgi:hypothetical protein
MSSERFDPGNYLAKMARRLVVEFEDAGDAGTPGLIGAAKEHPARQQLERILPQFAGVGTGLVIDSFGGVSKQQDIVVFEEQLCPVFTINDTAETGRFPVEGVIAAGEVKSSLDAASLEDAFEKVASVKRLRRHSVATDGLIGIPTHSFRQYGNGTAFDPALDEQFDQDKKPTDQVYGFILAGKSSLKPSSLLSKCVEFARKFGSDAPNAIICLDAGLFHPLTPENKLSDLPANASSWARSDIKEVAFNFLVDRLSRHCRHGRTVPTSAYAKYIHVPPTLPFSEIQSIG